MKIAFRITYAALACALVAGSLAPVTARADEADKIVEYFRKKANVPPQVPAKVNDLKDSTTMKGAKEGVLELGTAPNTQKQPFVLSKDGRYVVFGEIADLTVDPYKQVMEKI